MTREHHPDTSWYNFAEFLCYEKKWMLVQILEVLNFKLTRKFSLEGQRT